MTALHRQDVTPDKRSRARTVAAAAVASAVLLGGGAAVAVGLLGDDVCPQGRTPLHVAVSPDLAPAVTSVAADLATDEVACVAAIVSATVPAEVVSGLAGGEIRPPDVWVPDSSLWLTRASTDKVADAENAPSVASSPLVLAMPSAAADQLGRASKRPEVADVVEAGKYGRPVTLQLSDQKLSPARVGTILALQAAVAKRPDARGALAGLLQAARVDDTAPSAQLAPLTPAENVAVPVPEQAVWASNDADGPASVVAVYPQGYSFDYPYAVLSEAPETARAADALLAALRGDAGQAKVRAAGFRDADGGADPALSAVRGVDPRRSSVLDAPDERSLALAERTLASVKTDARLLAVIDVSGSMAFDVPGAKGETRLSLATKAASRGLGLYPDTTQVGLWVFSSELTRSTDYKQLVPISPLAGAGGGTSGRQRVAAALAQVKALPKATGLYDTTLAAVRAVRRGWQPGRVNAVVLLSDGEDTDHSGVSLPRLLSVLAGENDPKRRVPVITIAYGPDSGAAALARISKVTQGAAYTAKDPRQIRDVFLDAIGQRACRPNCAPSPLA